MPDITGVNHIALTVNELDVSEPWYTEVLGLTQVMKIEEPAHKYVVLIHPGTQLVVGLHAHDANEGEAFKETRTGLDHVGFQVESRAALESWKVRFDELGVEHSAITDAPYGGVLVFRDPDNIQLEMFCWPES
jgi:glyoxylase I family protein